MKKTGLFAVFVLLSMVFSGCFDLNGLSETSRFARAIPSADEVTLSVPDDDPLPDGLRVGETAYYYSQTLDTTTGINSSVDSLISALEELAAAPPTEETDEQAIWGPITPDDSPTTSMLVIDEVSATTYRFEYRIRPSSSDDDADFRSLISGSTVLTADGERDSGQFVVDFSTLHDMDSSYEYMGEMNVSYEAMNGSFRSVEVWFENFYSTAADSTVEEPVELTYRYLEVPSGAGDFQFAYTGNIHDEPDQPLEEMYQVRSRWDSAGAGRADVLISGGEISVELSDLGFLEEQIEVTECWDEGYLRTWYVVTPGADDEMQGDASSCVYGDTLFADSDIVAM